MMHKIYENDVVIAECAVWNYAYLIAQSLSKIIGGFEYRAVNSDSEQVLTYRDGVLAHNSFLD